jgi:putative hydrolase of HD superfamily
VPRVGAAALLQVKYFGKPEWRNWQTRRTQNPVAARPCGFNSLFRHQIYREALMEIPANPARRLETEIPGQKSDLRIEQQLEFLLEADKPKKILRRTLLTDGSRRENSAEHSWHLALAAIVLEEYSAEPVNMAKVLRMVAVHDVVEIDAGDTFAFDKAGNATKEEREQRAADRIFRLLPSELGAELRSLWEEFDEVATPEARFANAVDRIQPFLQNRATFGGTWRIYNLSRDQVVARMEPVRTALPRLWPVVIVAVDEFFSKQTG